MNKAVKCLITKDFVIIDDLKYNFESSITQEEIKSYQNPSWDELLESNAEYLREMGEKLFQRVFSGEVLQKYKSTTPKPLALNLSNELSALPWEIMFDSSDWIARKRGIFRGVKTEQVSPDIIPKPGILKVLAVVADPLLESEHEQIWGDIILNSVCHIDNLRNLASERFPLEIRLLSNATKVKLQNEVSKNYHVIHYIGRISVKSLALESRHGFLDLAHEEWLEEQLTAAIRGGARLFILDAGFSKDNNHLVHRMVKFIINTGIPVVIATQGKISEYGENVFIRTLYGRLSTGKSIDEAIMDTRRNMSTEWQINPWEWTIPVVFVNDSLLEYEMPLNLIDAEMTEMISDSKTRVLEKNNGKANKMMKREENFVGRNREISEILRSLDPDAEEFKNIICLYGEDGIGKTSIAMEAVRRMEQWYDEVFWFSEGFDPLKHISKDGRFLDRLARKCEINLKLNNNPKDLSRKIKERIKDGYKRLIVIDGADSIVESGQFINIFRELPQTLGILLITSKPTALNAGHICVGPIGGKEASALIKAYTASSNTQLSSEEIDEAVLFAGGHTLILRLLASIASIPGKSLKYIINILKEEKENILDGVLKHSLEMCGDECKEILYAVGFFYPTTGLKTLKQIAKLTTADFDKGLKQARDLAMVEYYEDAERFSLHPIIRQEVIRFIESPEKKALYQDRFIELYSEFLNATIPMTNPEVAAKALGAPMLQGKTSERIQQAAKEILVKPALRMMESELNNCLLALEWSLEKDDADTATKFLDNLDDFLRSNGYWNEAIYYSKKVAESWHKHEEYRAEAACLFNLSVLYQNRGSQYEALINYKDALEAAEKAEDKELEAEILNGLGIAYRDKGQWDEAIEYFQKACEIFKETGKESEELAVINRIGLIYQQTNRWNEAITYFERSLEVSRKINDKKGEATALSNLARCYQMEGDEYQKVIELYESSLEKFENLGMEKEKQDILFSLGIVNQEYEDLDAAMNYYQQVLDISIKTDDYATQRTALNNIAFIHSRNQEWLESASACLEAFQLAMKTGSAEAIDSLRTIMQISRYMLDDNQFVLSAQLSQQLSQLIQESETKDEAMRTALAICHGVFTVINFVSASEGDKNSELYREAMELAFTLDEKTNSALDLNQWLEGEE
ncbi:tetratricopeptide repeat protein [Candidatus Poribacteria bacterium]|nr:tetratricopeptide repeat protein [Candidatus Poribacteria bacterium]